MSVVKCYSLLWRWIWWRSIVLRTVASESETFWAQSGILFDKHGSCCPLMRPILEGRRHDQITAVLQFVAKYSKFSLTSKPKIICRATKDCSEVNLMGHNWKFHAILSFVLFGWSVSSLFRKLRFIQHTFSENNDIFTKQHLDPENKGSDLLHHGVHCWHCLNQVVICLVLIAEIHARLAIDIFYFGTNTKFPRIFLWPYLSSWV